MALCTDVANVRNGGQCRTIARVLFPSGHCSPSEYLNYMWHYSASIIILLHCVNWPSLVLLTPVKNDIEMQKTIDSL